MRTLTLNELDSVSGGASGRDIAMAIGGAAWKTESMVTPVFATPILTISGLA